MNFNLGGLPNFLKNIYIKETFINIKTNLF
jgi:hypothetical protein